jgi:acetyltransferase-like isoleucine patch superfamily enzyme
MMNPLKFIKNNFTRRGKQLSELRRISHQDRTVIINTRQVQVGMFTYGLQNIEIAYHEDCPTLSIGRFCSIAGNVRIFLGAYHRSDWVSTFPFLSSYDPIFPQHKREGFPKSNGPVVIGNDVWIGHGVTIMSGIRIGDGAILAAGTHVVQDVEPYAIVGGNPGRVVKFRFDLEIRNELLRLKWWNWPLQKILDHQNLLSSNPVLSQLKSM